MKLPSGHHFVCLTFGDLHGAKSGKPAISLGDCLTVAFDPPVEIDDFWRKSLGDLNYGLLRDASFSIIDIWPHGHKRPQEHWRQHLPVNSVMYGVFLQGMPHYDPVRGLSLAGDTDKLPRNLTQSYIKHFYRHRFDRILTIDHQAIELARQIATGIRFIYAGDQFARLKRGFDAWIRGVAQDRLEYRLHEFVRALEALLLPAHGNQFVQRAKSLARIPKADMVLREIYNLRNQVEHLNEWQVAFDDNLKNRLTTAELGDRAMVRSFQIELLAGAVYTKVLSTPDILANFIDDAAIQTFWTAPNWAKQLGLEKLLNSRFDTPRLDKTEADRLRSISS